MDYQSVPDSSGIYAIRNIANGKMYVGSAVRMKHRLHQHVYDLRRNKHHSQRLQNAWNSYGEHNFKFLVLSAVQDAKQLIETEQQFLDWHKSYDRDIGYNINAVAGSQLGRKRTDETKAKIGERSRLNWCNPAYKDKMREYTRKQMADKCKPFMCNESGTTYESTRQAGTALGLDHSAITKVLKGKLRQTHGYTFHYLPTVV